MTLKTIQHFNTSFYICAFNHSYDFNLYTSVLFLVVSCKISFVLFILLHFLHFFSPLFLLPAFCSLTVSMKNQLV